MAETCGHQNWLVLPGESRCKDCGYVAGGTVPPPPPRPNLRLVEPPKEDKAA